MCVDDETPLDDGPSYFAGCLAAIVVFGLAFGWIAAAVWLGLHGGG